MTQIVVAPELGLEATLRRQVVALREQEWPEEADDVEFTHDPALDPMTMVLINHDRVVAALDILAKAIEHRGVAYRACGLSTVVTDAALRGNGFGRLLVTAARERMSDSFDLCVFTCDPSQRAFYERMGFEELVGTVLVGGTPGAPLRSDVLNKVVFAEGYTTPLDGYVGVEVAIYPGLIDRLW